LDQENRELEMKHDYPLTQDLLCEGWHFTHLWKTLLWPHHSPKGSFVPIKLMLCICMYRCCLFLRLFYLIFELFRQCAIFCFSFHYISFCHFLILFVT